MKVINNTIKITCETKDFLEYKQLTRFQGDLKEHTKEDTEKVIKSIQKFGFTFPVFVWVHNDINYIFDGHNRLEALKTLDDRGYLIPPLPVVYVGTDLENEDEAKDLLLRLNSNYGKMTKESVLDFLGDIDVDMNNYNLPISNMGFEAEEIDPLEVCGIADEPKEHKPTITIEFENETECEGVYYKLVQMGLNPKVKK